MEAAQHEPEAGPTANREPVATAPAPSRTEPARGVGSRAAPRARRSVQRGYLEVALVWILGFALFTWTYGRADGVPGNDSFYHIKMAAMLPEHGLMTRFPWLRFVYFTDRGDDFVSHHYGFHALLAPFIFASRAITGDYFAGANWAMAAFFALNLVLFDRLLRACGVRGRWFWIGCLVLMPHHFFSRHAFVRAIAPSLACSLAILLALIRRRPFVLAVLVAAYIHIYLGGLLYAPVMVAAFVAASVLAPGTDGRIPWKLLLAATIGWGIGAATHPYAAGMGEFLRLQVLGTGLAPDISVGREWQPYSDLWWFARMVGPMLALWTAAMVARLRVAVPATAAELAILFCHLGFLVLTLKARRFMEYWPIFCMLSAATLAAPWLNALAARVEGTTPQDAPGRPRWRWTWRVASAACVVAAGLIVLVSPPWRELRKGVGKEFDLPAIRAAMDFLRVNSDRGDVVFTDDWDIFPVFFYYNTHNHYIVGLDPKFTHHRDPVLWERYVKVSRGQVPADVEVDVRDRAGEVVKQKARATLQDIRDQFGARFVITDRDHKALARKLAGAEEFAELIYPSSSYADSADAAYLIFRIRDSEGG